MRARQRDYDAKCYELAEHFLDDYEMSKEDRAAKADKLAEKLHGVANWFCRDELDVLHIPRRAEKVERNAAGEAFPR